MALAFSGIAVAQMHESTVAAISGQLVSTTSLDTLSGPGRGEAAREGARERRNDRHQIRDNRRDTRQEIREDRRDTRQGGREKRRDTRQDNRNQRRQD